MLKSFASISKINKLKESERWVPVLLPVTDSSISFLFSHDIKTIFPSAVRDNQKLQHYRERGATVKCLSLYRRLIACIMRQFYFTLPTFSFFKYFVSSRNSVSSSKSRNCSPAGRKFGENKEHILSSP